MPKRRPPWFVSRDPSALRYAFFISHVSEDADAVRRLKSDIQAAFVRRGSSLDCFLDVHDWEIGNDASGVIKAHLLKSAHMVVWASKHYLASTRGWVWTE